MQLIEKLPVGALSSVRGVLTDLDDTLTRSGKLPVDVYTTLGALAARGVRLGVITGRPAGWADLMARLWPVDGVIAENGAVAFFVRDGHVQRLVHPSVQDPDMPIRLERLREAVLRAVPGSRLASDQFCRLYDVAFDIAETPPFAEAATIRTILETLHAQGATAQRSSIHVNAWLGSYDKYAMARLWVQHMWNEDLDTHRDAWLCVGDSPNDAPLFRALPLSFGVANIQHVVDAMPALPRYVTTKPGGEGFMEVAQKLLAALPSA